MDATRSVLDSIRRLVRALRVASRAAERTHGVSTAQLFALQKLKEEGSLSITELAERTLTDPSSVSVVVSKLVDHGLVVRAPSAHDARRAEVRLTEAGRRLTRSIDGTEQEKLVSALVRLPLDERAELARLLQKFIDLAGLAPGPVPLFFEDDKE